MADNDRQRAVLAILPKVSATLSLIGSIWIIVEVTTNRTKRRQVYHRILLAMSVYDVLESVWNFASTWPIPRNTENIFNPLGTTGTCTAQGFFLQFGLGIPIYNAWLSFYYYLYVARHMKEEQIKRNYWEWIFHGTTFLASFGTAISGILLDLYNNANLWCWIADFPSGCDKDSNVDCERGAGANIYRWAFYFGPLWACLVMALVFILAIYAEVWSLENAAVTQPKDMITSLDENNSFAGDGKSSKIKTGFNEETMNDEQAINTQGGGGDYDDDDDDDYIDNVQPNKDIIQSNKDIPKNVNKRSSTQQVMNQCLWYLAAFYMTHLFSTINRGLQLSRDESFFPLLVFHAIFDPLQGALNFLVYRRPLYLRYRRQRPNIPRYKCWLLALRFHFTYDAEKERREAILSKERREIEEERQRKLAEIEKMTREQMARDLAAQVATEAEVHLDEPMNPANENQVSQSPAEAQG